MLNLLQYSKKNPHKSLLFLLNGTITQLLDCFNMPSMLGLLQHSRKIDQYFYIAKSLIEPLSF
jgi:hypothetical protein